MEFFQNIDLMLILRCFIVGGLICVVGQILIDKTKLTPARILVIFVTAGVVLGGLGIYKYVIDEMKSYIEKNINVDEIDYISGGERRDWYFSNMMAYLLQKPHVTIYKDLTTIESTSDFSESKPVSEIKGKKFLHLADLLNQSASFTRAWIPAIKNLGSNIVWSIFAVDRMQGGTETLTNDGVKVLSLLQIDESLFTTAKELGIINNEQLEMLINFKKDPDGSMKQFLIDHPEFIENAKKSDNPRTVKRVNTLIEQNIYGLN